MLLLAFALGSGPSPSRDEFERAALPYLPEIYRTAVGLLGGNRTEAEDLAQDVFLEAWKSFHRFEPGTNIRAWLHKILVHRASRFRRRLFRLLPFGNKDESAVIYRQRRFRLRSQCPTIFRIARSSTP